jgi:CRP-like cAMP-binding protein
MQGVDERLIDLLSAAELFGRLAKDELSACAALLREVRFAKGEMLFVRGEPGTRLFFVEEGQVRLAISTSEGRELSFKIAGPGDLFGEFAVFDGSPRSADATALTPVKAFSLERQDFRRLSAERPAISDAVIAHLCHRLRVVSDQFESVALYPLHMRVARFLLIALGDQEAPPDRRVPLALGYSQSELALLLGASRPKINAALSALEETGAIKRTADRLFCDPKKLASIARQDDE